MAISVNIQRIKSARARRISDYFSTVDCTADTETDGWFGTNEISLFIEGPGHEDAAARIAALINEQVVRRDTPPIEELSKGFVEHDDGPTYDGDEQLRMETELAAKEQEEREAYETEDRLGKEAHLRAVRRDDKPWTPHEDEIERDVAEGRRDADGEPV